MEAGCTLQNQPAQGTSCKASFSVGEPPVAYEGRGDGGEGKEVFRLSLVAAVQASAAGQPGHGPFHDPAVLAQASG